MTGTTDASALERRIDELEARVAFQEDLIAELERVLAALAGEFDRVRPHLLELRGRVDALQVALSHDAANEPPPPHY